MKKYLLLTPLALFPYLILLSMYLIFFQYELLAYIEHLLIMEGFYIPIVFIILGMLLFLWLLSFVFLFVFSHCCSKQENGLLELARSNLVVKLIHIPAYLIIFILGIICLITVFTIGFSLAFIIFDCMTIFLTGMLGLCAILRGRSHGLFYGKRTIFFAVLQFLFCLDIVGAILLYRKVRATQVNTQA